VRLHHFAAIFSLGLVPGARADIIGVTDHGTSSDVYDVDSRTGTVSLIGTTPDYRLYGASLGSNGLLYAYGEGTAGGTNPSFHGLLTIAPTGQVTPVASITGLLYLQGIEFKNGVLYGRQGTSLYRLPLTGGPAVLVGNGSLAATDMALRSDGTMFETWAGNFPQGGLHTVDLNTGATVDLFPNYQPGYGNLMTGITFGPDGTLYGFGRCQGGYCLSTIDLLTGAPTAIGAPNPITPNVPYQIAYVGGQSEIWPLLPSVTKPGLFIFQGAHSANWFDPPFAYGFDYQMTSGSLFTRILGFPSGFNSPFQVIADGQNLGTFGPGMTVDFTGFAGGGVSSFSILGIDPLVDAANPAGFPLKLEFNTSTADFQMSALTESEVPEPATFFAAGIALMLFGAARRRYQARRR
jgi:hypothetical protein